MGGAWKRLEREKKNVSVRVRALVAAKCDGIRAVARNGDSNSVGSGSGSGTRQQQQQQYVIGSVGIVADTHLRPAHMLVGVEIEAVERTRMRAKVLVWRCAFTSRATYSHFYRQSPCFG